MTDIEQFKALLDGNDNKLIEDLVNHKKEVNVNDRWSGMVIDNLDPSRLGRVRIRVIGFYDNISETQIPWAVPDISFIGSTKGSFIIPEIGTVVRGYFDKGDVQKPIYDSVAFNLNTTKSSFTKRDSITEYPHKMVLFETDRGDYLTLNRSTGEMVFTHRSGTMYHIDNNGSITIQTSQVKMGNLEIKVQGDTTITTNGNTTLKSIGNVDIKSTTGKINLGNNPAKQPVNNLTTCPIIGCPLAVGNTQVLA